MAEPTKADLQAENEKLRKQLEEQNKALEAQAEAIQKMEVADQGWLVQTPLADFDGERCGIYFSSGQAFVRKGQEVEYFEVEPMKESTMDKLKMPETEREAVREREKITSAERCVEYFEKELGYKVFEVNGNKAEVDLLVDERTRQRMEMDKQNAMANSQVDLVKPGYMGE